MSTRSYEDAIERLNSLQSNAATLEAIRASPMTELVIPRMLEYLERIGYKVCLYSSVTERKFTHFFSHKTLMR